jgi:hypothetical protein
MILLGAALCVAVTFALNEWSAFVSELWYPGLAFLIILSVAFNIYYYSKRDSDSFAGLLIGGVALRLLLSLVFLLLLWFFARTHFFVAAIHFMAHYTLFALFEIRYLSLLAAGRRSSH